MEALNYQNASAAFPEEEDNPLFQTADFRMWCMKVIPCSKRYVHDWTTCNFSHAGEKAVRRCPRSHEYTGIACPDMKKKGSCIRGERCPYAHNVFEYWLHPTRYRTQLCNDGPGCRRSICFFAHSLDELRVPACKPYVSPETLARASLEAIQQNPHPLGVQLPFNVPPQHQNQDQSYSNGGSASGSQRSYSSGNLQSPQSYTAAQQQAALAAMSGAPPQAGGMRIPPQSPFVPPNGMPHTHINQAPPRISTDYGSLPRWSDCSPYYAGHSGVRMSGGGPISVRMSGGAGSDYASACSTPARLSSDIPAGSMPPAGRHSSDGGPSPPPPSNPVSLERVGEDELAQSLATLKIALTQQQVAASTASNHEVVISTLHQILKEAVQQQNDRDSASASASGGSSPPRSTGADSAAAASIAAAALNSVARFGSRGSSLTISESSADTPQRMSVESPTLASVRRHNSRQFRLTDDLINVE